MSKKGPRRIICLTEESVEMLYLLGEEQRIIGVSHYAVRPEEVKQKEVVSVFTHANIKKVLTLNPDLVIGFSDIQKDIAKDLIAEGIQVLITNQRSIEEILETMEMLSLLVDKREKGEEIINSFRNKILEIKEKVNEDQKKYSKIPKIYIEEWNGPTITGIRWFSELVEICGGEAIFKEKSYGKMARDRFVTKEELREVNPDIILACWCGKSVDFEDIKGREWLKHSRAVVSNNIYELIPEIFLQPGPALFIDGLDHLYQLILNWKIKHK